MDAWAITLIGAACTLLGGIGMDIYKRKNPSASERQGVENSRVSFLKTYNDAQYVHLQLDETIKKMVNERTEKFEEILVRREMEHSQQLEVFIKKAAEETARAEDYWEQLKDARKETAYWRALYEDLKAKQDKKSMDK